jgi:hypothetical protein
MHWTYFYVFLYFPLHGHAHVQTFQPPSASGLNEQASPIETLSSDILAT